jgi:hypothetical protein
LYISGGKRENFPNSKSIKKGITVNNFRRLLVCIALSLVTSHAFAGALDDDFSETLMVNLEVADLEVQAPDYSIPELPMPVFHDVAATNVCVFRDAGVEDVSILEKADKVDLGEAVDATDDNREMTSCTSSSCELICSRQLVAI